ncbi:MAG: hypothetical protein AAGM22_27825 [Acidobacteriota bacterium]
MFFFRNTVTVFLVLIISTQPALAQPAPESQTGWLEPARALWEDVMAIVDVFLSAEPGSAEPGPVQQDYGPSSEAQGSHSWIDPSGQQGAESFGGLTGDADDSGSSRQHGWIDPTGLRSSGDQPN